MANIPNIDEQINKVIDEINRTYSKGIDFTLADLSSVRAVENMGNFISFLPRCRAKITSSGTARYSSGMGINQNFYQL